MEDETTAVEAPAAPAAPPVAPEPGPGPWSADLAAYIEDETARQAADRYLREKVQPRITELEQGTAQARALWDDLLADPQQTLTDVIADIYGDEVAAALPDLLSGIPDEEEAPVPEPTEAPLPEHIQQMYEQFTADQQQRAYETELARVKAANPDLVDSLFHPFVVSTEGDFDRAVEAYKAFEDQARQRYGQAPPAAPDAPAVVGTTGQGAAAPPTTKQYASIDEALEDTLADLRRAAAPPTVGGV